MVSTQRRAPELKAGFFFGLGLGGFFDGIVLHQLLQWHHVASNHEDFPVNTVAGLEANVFWDGLFHAFTYIAVVIGVILLWKANVTPESPWSTSQFIGTLVLGFGVFNVVEGLINHQLLGIHHVNETVAEEHWIWWDLGFLAWGAVMIVIGWLLAKKDPEQKAPHTS